MQIVIEDKVIGTIPVLNVYNDNQTGRLPVVIMMHGLDSHKENNLKPAYKLARAGFFVVVFDALFHGERSEERFTRLTPIEKYRETLQIQLDSVQAVDALVADCRNHPRANPERVGLMGFSSGGNAVYKYISNPMPDYIKAAVVFAGTPCWSGFLRKIALNPEAASVISPAFIAEVEAVEPCHTIGRLRDFPLLMVNGTRDELFAAEALRQCYRELETNYGLKERLVQLEFPNAGHSVTDEMLPRATEWFLKYLK